MQEHARYEIIDTIGQGAFATVFRGRDKELGREVAIKQIHQQYLDDPQQLDRYWREAQLMATLDHPRIMTIYDVVREKGWLILELMEGSLEQLLAGRPIDLKDLRLALTYALSALECLEQHGIIHGDVKPSNLLVDKNRRVKLGDFGIARRIAGDEGSVVKGTTKYMAPEVVSDQFGEVGPHSDLYSLGFSAFDLMCGKNFETLFPGLNMFGRDRQIAWMMWHSAPDRRLPEIQRVLQGVPDDLAFIVTKLTEKDPAKRYRNAAQVLEDLRRGDDPSQRAAAEEEQAKAEQQAKQARQKRRLAVAALAASLLLTLAVVLIPQGGKKPTTTTTVEARPTAGVVGEIDLQRSRFFLTEPGGVAQGVDVRADKDRILLNDVAARLENLEKGDEVNIEYLAGKDARKLIVVTRAVAVEQAGVIETVHSGAGVIAFIPTGEQTALKIYVPATAAVTLNGESAIHGRPVGLSDLKPQDRLTVQHVPGKEGRAAKSLHAQRLVRLEGSLVSVDTAKRKLTVRVGQGQNAVVKELPVSPDCQITLNGESHVGGKVLLLADLKAEDKLTIEHDSLVTRIAAQRQLAAPGVVKRVDYAEKRFVAVLDGRPGQTPFTLAPDCRITILKSGKGVDFSYLRVDDRVEVTHDSPNLKDARALALSVDGKPDAGAWAAVIGQQQYDDKRVSALRHTGADAETVRDALQQQYRVPDNQFLFLRDATKTRLEQDVGGFLKNVKGAGQLIVFFAGHAYVDPTGAPFLAPKEIDMGRIAETGWSLRGLIAQMEAAQAAEKILLLDTCHQGDGNDLQSEPSSAELVELLRESPSRAPSTSVTVVASCEKGQRGLTLDPQGRGLFASHTAAAFEGQADQNLDQRVNADELMRFLGPKMAGHVGPRQQQQTAKRFLPDATPPRLPAEVRAAALKLLDCARQNQLGDDFHPVFEKAQPLAPKHADLELAYALGLLKHNLTSNSLRVFDYSVAKDPDALLAYHALAWQYFMKGDRQKGINNLADLVRKIPRPRGDRELGAYEAHVIEFAGKLRQFALKAAESSTGAVLSLDDVKVLDQAVLEHCEAAKQRYAAGIEAVSRAMDALDQAAKAASNPESEANWKRDRNRLTYYAKFDFDVAEAFLRELLKK